MNKVKTGVVGAGHLGRAHINKYLNIEESDFIGFWDVLPEVRHRVESESGVKPFSSLEELLDEADAVSIVVPTSFHAEIGVEAAKRGTHIFVEKPIASSLKEADDIIEAAEKFGVKLQVGHIERFNSAFRNLKYLDVNPKFVESHRLASFNPRGLDVPVILDLMIHDIDLILQLIPAEIEKIDTSGVGVISDSCDIVNARLTFVNGAVANITASRISQKRMRKMRMFQKDAYISLDFDTGETEIFKIADAGKSFDDTSVLPVMELAHEGLKKTVGYKKIPNDGKDSLELELRAFVDSIQNNTLTPINGHAARKALAVALEIFDKSIGIGGK